MCSENRQFPDIQTLMNMRIFIILITCLYIRRWHDYCYLIILSILIILYWSVLVLCRYSNLRILFDFFWENDLKIKRRKEGGPAFSKMRIRCFAIILSTALQFYVCKFPFLFNALQKAKNLYISYSYTCFPGIFQANVY